MYLCLDLPVWVANGSEKRVSIYHPLGFKEGTQTGNLLVVLLLEAISAKKTPTVIAGKSVIRQDPGSPSHAFVWPYVGRSPVTSMVGVFPKIGVGFPPKWMVKIMENP